MNVARKSLFNKICAMLVVIALTISDFLFVGQTAVSIAVDTIRTNSSNVDFSVYFLDSNNEKTEKLEENIDKGEEYLYVDISVKNEGYFNGTLTIDNNNFNIKNEVLSEYVAEISSNVVKLNQINAGSNVTLKFAIEPIDATSITSEMLNSNTKVNLNGQYVNSKNVEKDKYVDISGTAVVSINWKSSENTEVELNSSLLTNAVYTTENETNRVVQILVNSKITNNNYPVKNTNIVLSVPQNVKNVTVHSRNNNATNSSVKFSDANYTYNKEENKLTITVANENESNISWAKNVQDSFVVTYILDKEENVLNSEISVLDEINTYDDKKLSSDMIVHIDKEIDGIVSFDLNSTESSIYKGKIYTGEERNYVTTSKIYVDYLGANNIYLNEDASTFVSSETKMASNIVYKQLKINKNEFLTLFGNDGKITIKDNNGVTVLNIDSKTEADQDGNIIVNLSEGTTNLAMETSKPIAIGTLNIENTKSILASGYSRETVTELTNIEDSINGNYDGKTNTSLNNRIELKNTSSKSEFNVSVNTLSSIEENKDVKITTILLNNDESKDLYQNPTLKITFPKQVKAINKADFKMLYDNGLELANGNVSEENGNKVINLELAGTQTTYNTETLEGTTIIIYADLEVDKLATTSDEEIVMNYTNEIATSFQDNGEQKSPVKIVAEQGVITTNDIKSLDVETAGKNESKEVLFDIASQEKDLTVDISTINNEDTAIENVEILGTFPTNSNLGIKLTNGINITSNTSSAKVYYSNKENATKDLNDSSNNWTLDGNLETAKSYFIKIDNMEIGEQFSANYTIKVPANLNYNLNASEGYTVDYTKFLNTDLKTAKATTLNLTTGTGAEVKAELKAYKGGKELTNNENVYNGDIIKYEVKVKNVGTEPAKNVNLALQIPENTTAVDYVKRTNEEKLNDYFMKRETTNTLIESLGIDEERTIPYDVLVGDSTVNTTLQAKAEVEYIGKANSENTTRAESNSVSNNVVKADVTLNMVMTIRGVEDIQTGKDYPYTLNVKNTSGRKLENVQVKINTNSFEVVRVILNNQNLKFDNNTFYIPSLDVDETKAYEIDVVAKEANEKATISATVNDLYTSNEILENIKATSISVSMTANNEGKTITSNDSSLYIIKVTNNGTDSINSFDLIQKLSKYMDVKKVYTNGNEIRFNKIKATNNTENTEESDEYIIGMYYEEQLKAGDSIEFFVETQPKNTYIREEDIQLTSTAQAKIKGLIATSEEVNHVLKANAEKSTDNSENTESNNSNNNSSTDNSPNYVIVDDTSNKEKNETEQKHTISGTAWFDENADGKRDSNEKLLSGIKVTLLNLEDNTTATATTSENGFYSISDVSNGKYVEMFEYDTDKYMLTKYHAENVQDARNSDVENVTMNLNGESKKVASTDTLTVNNSSLTNIDIGLMEAKIFDLSLSKSISKVSISNTNGTESKEYNSSELAKIEIKAKYLSGTTAVIEYKIKVTNNGEVAGYARNIVDYKPADLSFNSKLNPDWYQSGEYLYSTALANTKIEAGESKELTLILTKTMTENNTGLTNNTAEIAESYNALGIEDRNSTSGNKQAKEDDLGQANIIISVSTGAAVSYISLTLSIIAVIAVGAYIVTRKILKENVEI